jgi:hypothetical protein
MLFSFGRIIGFCGVGVLLYTAIQGPSLPLFILGMLMLGIAAFCIDQEAQWPVDSKAGKSSDRGGVRRALDPIPVRVRNRR